MSGDRSYLDYLEDVRNNLDAAMRFTAGMSFEEFEDDDRTQYAVIRALEIVGEAVKHIPDDVRDRHPHVPWKAMSGMRDRLIHSYLRVSLRVVWDAAKYDAPKLRPLIENIITSE